MESQNHLRCDENLAGHSFQNHYFKPKPRAAAEHEAVIYKYIQTHCPTIPFFNILACQSGAKQAEAAILELQEVTTLDDALRSSLLPIDKIRQLIGQTFEVYLCYYKHGLVHNDLKVQMYLFIKIELYLEISIEQFYLKIKLIHMTRHNYKIRIF